MLTLKIEGAKELEAALRNLPKEIIGKVLREALRKSALPMQEQAQARAPRSATPGPHGHMADSIALRARVQQDLFDTEINLDLGPDADHFYGMFGEFGTKHQDPKPFLRPAFDSEAAPTIDHFGKALWVAIERGAKKLAKGPQ